jgi:hypothetical protein
MMSAISRRITPHCDFQEAPMYEASCSKDILTKLTSRLYLRRPRPASGIVQRRLPSRSHGMPLSNLAGISAKRSPLNQNMRKSDDKIYPEETAFPYAKIEIFDDDKSPCERRGRLHQGEFAGSRGRLSVRNSPPQQIETIQPSNTRQWPTMQRR